MDEALKRVRRSIAGFEQCVSPDEETTRDKLINPILNSLGWDIQDNEIVKTQYKVPNPQNPKRKKKADYALFDDEERPIAFVEAKPLYNSLGSDEQRQLEEYVVALREDIRKLTRVYGGKHLKNFRLAVLTNGKVWKFYPVSNGTMERHSFHSIDLTKGEIEECVSEMKQFLLRARVLAGEAREALESKILDGKLATTWQRLLQSPPEGLVEIVQDELKGAGYTASSKQVKEFLRDEAIGGADQLPPPASMPTDPNPASIPGGGYWGLLKVKYQGELIPGTEISASEVFRTVLGRIVQDYGEERFYGTITKAKKWITKDVNDARHPQSYDWQAISVKLSVNLNLGAKAMGKRLGELAAELGIADQLEIEFIPSTNKKPQNSIDVDVGGKFHQDKDYSKNATGVMMAALADMVKLPQFEKAKLDKLAQNVPWLSAQSVEVEHRHHDIEGTDYKVDVKTGTAGKARHLRKFADEVGVGDQVKVWLNGKLVK